MNVMESNKIPLFSELGGTRISVICLTMFVDELMSKTLAFFLDIEWKNSRSLGHKASALSFNQKAQILQDLNSIDRIMIKKINYLMVIRNKFAHVGEVDSFEKFYQIASNGKEIERTLNQWYSKLINLRTPSFETIHKNYFFNLVVDIAEFLMEISQKRALQIGYEKGKNEAILNTLESLVFELRQLENGDQIINQALDNLEKRKNRG